MGAHGQNQYDICVVGGGVNGTGIARDAAGRGLRVLLLEKSDLASATSSASTKLIHGGLRYLEYKEFRLVHESLRERDVLLRLAPHIIWPMTFILPHAPHLRPYWLVRLGLYAYDLLSYSFGQKRLFPASAGVTLEDNKFGAPLKHEYRRGVSYSDGWVQDSRLTVLNAMDARARGADILTRATCTGLAPQQGGWSVAFKIRGDETVRAASAKLVVNAAGPWARDLLETSSLVTQKTPAIRLVQGSHIVVPKIYDGDHAYIFQQPDKRIVFAIPYEGKFTLIGTTDTDFRDDPSRAKITEEEKDYLLGAAGLYFKKTLSKAEIVWAYSGVRPLLEDEQKNAKAVTRDYKIQTEYFKNSPILSAFGGKITTYRKLSEKTLTQICSILKMPDEKWTGKEPLPGGDIEDADFAAFLREQKIRYEGENQALLERYARNYGTKMSDILGRPKGEHYGEEVYEAELKYLVEREFAREAEDVLWRRSKLGLHLSAETVARIEAAMPDFVAAHERTIS